MNDKKKALLITFSATLVFHIIGCKGKSTDEKADSISSVVTKNKTIKSTDTSKDLPESAKGKKLIGVWMASDSDSPDFEIKKSTIRYFRHPGDVPYQILGDSINIAYEKGYSPSFLIELKGMDTLILTGETGVTILHRVK